MEAPRRFDIKPMDGISWVITLLCAAAVLVAALDGKIEVTIPMALIIGLVMGWFRPLTLEVDAEALRIVCPLRKQVFERSTILRAWRLDYGVLRPMVRVGVGGLFGYFGMFLRPGKGSVNVCITTTRDLVLLELEDRPPLLLSPRDPAAFLESLDLSEELGAFE